MTDLIRIGVGVLVVVFLATVWRRRRRRVTLGAGAAGAVYDLLNEDKRAALEIVVEDRAAYRDPEDRDGDLPQLETPPRPARRSLGGGGH